MSMATATEEQLQRTPLWNLHRRLGARMVPFAGYDMPVQYETGVKAEHMQVREKAGLFDVSHMGQVTLKSGNGDDPADLLEKLVPSDIRGLAVGKMRYTVLLNKEGGIFDDLIVTRLDDNKLLLVLNAARKQADMEYIRAEIGETLRINPWDDRALMALQGAKATEVMARVFPDESFADMGFMSSKYTVYEDEDILVSRSGYTGEDGFEISVSETNAEKLAEELLADGDTAWPIGLGARDSLRLEAGLCLYGHDIWEETTPVEAGLTWVIPKARRHGEAGYYGAEKITGQIENGPPRKRVGLLPEGRAPVREGVELFDADGKKIGIVTSGGYSPVLEMPMAMGYVDAACAANGTKILAKMRGKDYPCDIVKMPFVKKDKG